MNFIKEKSDSYTTKDLFLGISAGREINIARSFGIDFDAGVGFDLSHSATGDVLDIHSKVFPLLNMNLFFRW